MFRLVDCIECAMCISACPVPLTDPGYQGPAILAAIQHQGIQTILSCSLSQMAEMGPGAVIVHMNAVKSVLPFVDPAWRIMDLRKQVVKTRIQKPLPLINRSRNHENNR
jgi:succinate dehydrogenase/fumarate reductase-like Fe-S protein